ncbi:MAG: ribonuclease P protein component [Cytophagales bacterium]|nr:ribonuclease P protein component [Rhizobacter sp.]
MIGRIVRSVDFERVLGSPIRARSAHFAVHFLESRPSQPAKPRAEAVSTELSTGQAPEQGMAVDDFRPHACWLGSVVPKRHARRSVTRNLIKRQIRRVAAAQTGLAHGLWVVRLRSPFDKQRFQSASSDALQALAGEELASLLAEAARRVLPA